MVLLYNRTSTASAIPKSKAEYCVSSDFRWTEILLGKVICDFVFVNGHYVILYRYYMQCI